MLRPGFLYAALTGSLRFAAHTAPRNLGALRTVADLKVPRFLLHRDVHVEHQTMETAGGPMHLEWVVPERALPQQAPGGDAPRRRRLLRFRRRVAPAERRYRRVMLYMHGGAFTLCTPGSLRGSTFPIARAAGAALCVPQYRRPPEHSIAQAVEDGLAAYAHLLEEHPDAEIYLGGDSAGGGLAASMLAALRGSSLPFPKAVVLLSPWTDLSGDGAEAGLAHTSASNVSRKDYVTRGKVAFLAAAARGDLAPDRAPVSPMYAEGSLADLPPIFVVYGKSEVLAGQVERFCDAWSERGASIECHGVRGGVHVPVLFHFCHRASKVALARLRNFLSLEPQPPGGGASGDGGVGGDGGGL